LKFTHTHAPADHSQTLAHIAELSRNARATWFGLIGLCVFVGVTLLGHQDADFFAFGAETQLRLVNVKIPVTYFFVFAPVLVAALYIYLHLYLMNLWDALADAPARIDGNPLADTVFPWLISHAALWYRNRVRGDHCTAPRALGWVVVMVSIFLGWAFGLIVLFFLWYRSLPAHEEWLTLWIALCLWAATTVGYTGIRAARARMWNRPRAKVARSHERSRWLAGGLAALLAFLSWETTEGGLQTLNDRGLPPFLYPADLREANLTRKLSGTVRFEFWIKEFEPTYRDRENIDKGTDLTGNREYIAEATARYNAPLDAPDLAGRDMRNADMRNAFLPGTDLRGIEMQGANLSGADMQPA
jgi:hypothetical protein